MFSFIAQYIGYGAESKTEDLIQSSNVEVCSFGETQEGDWTLVELPDRGLGGHSDAVGAEEEFHRVPSSSPLASLHSSTSEDVHVVGPVSVTTLSAAAQISARRTRCSKNCKKQRVNQPRFTQQRPNQMKRCNQVFCSRGMKAAQKMRQIVHQPRKF